MRGVRDAGHQPFASLVSPSTTSPIANLADDVTVSVCVAGSVSITVPVAIRSLVRAVMEFRGPDSG
jgi:hypothetical protein